MIRSGFHTLVNMKEMALTSTHKCVYHVFSLPSCNHYKYMCFLFLHHYVTHFLMFLHGLHGSTI